MHKYTWYVFTIKDEDGKFYSFAERIRNNYNLVDYAKQAYTMNACDSMKKAKEIAAAWNEAYIKNGTANKWIMPRSTAKVGCSA